MENFNNDNLISLQNVYKKYNNQAIINNFNLDIKQGQRIAIIGPNGSGKSTVSEIIGGIRKPTSGKVVKAKNMKIGIQFQESKYPYGITVMDMIKYYLETFKVQMNHLQLLEMLDVYQILPLADKMVQSLSGGQQQRLNILLSVIHQPDLVILDEVSTGLDVEVKEEIFSFLQTNIVEKNIAMILVSHNMSEIERFCQRVIFLHEGNIVDDLLVVDVIKQYGSAQNYMHLQLLKYKKDKQSNYLQTKLLAEKQKLNNQVTNLKINKQLSLIKLIVKYFKNGFYVPFYIFAYPIIILFLQGFAFKLVGIEALRSLVAGIAVTQIIAIGIFFIPQTIIDFKNSVLMKRIGASDIKALWFVSAIVAMGILSSIIAFLWTLLWAGIFFGHMYSWSLIASAHQPWSALPFLLIIFASAASFGIMLSSVIKNFATYITVSNIIYFPIAFLSGGLTSMYLIANNNILQYVKYINPFNYCVSPFIDSWIGKFSFNVNNGINLAVSLLLLSSYIFISTKKMSWEQ